MPGNSSADAAQTPDFDTYPLAETIRTATTDGRILTLTDGERLVPAIKEVLTQSIRDGGSTLRDYAAPDGELGYFATRFDVYWREGEMCRRKDGGTIRRFAQGGRSTWFCAKCQK